MTGACADCSYDGSEGQGLDSSADETGDGLHGGVFRSGRSARSVCGGVCLTLDERY